MLTTIVTTCPGRPNGPRHSPAKRTRTAAAFPTTIPSVRCAVNLSLKEGPTTRPGRIVVPSAITRIQLLAPMTSTVSDGVVTAGAAGSGAAALSSEDGGAAMVGSGPGKLALTGCDDPEVATIT